MSLISALAQALERSSADAIIYGSRRVSRAALSGQAERLRRTLIEAGVSPGDRVALLCPNHPAFVVAHLAILACGAILLPLNPLYQPLELAPLLRNASPRLLLCLSTSEGLAEASLELMPSDERPGLLVLIDDERDLAAEVPDRLEYPDLPPEAPAVLIYTSGTTGTPRAALLSHGNLEHNARFIARDWLGGVAGEQEVPSPRPGHQPPDSPLGDLERPPPLPGHQPADSPHVELAALPLCHNFGLNVTLDALLLHGGTLVLMPRFSAVEALRAIAAHRVTFLPLVPTMTSALLNNPELSRVDTSSLRLLVSGGAALPGPLRAAASSRFPGIALRDTYGLTEASLAACTRPDGSGRSDTDEPARSSTAGYGKPGTVGRPVCDTEIRVIDAEGRPCPPGEVGEIQVKGPGVMADYWRRPPEMPAPIRDGWLSTGDLGRLDDDGDLTVVDRKKDLIIHGGYKVYPLEVEEALYKHPSVAEAAVFGVPDPRMGEKVMACVAPHPGTLIDAGELQSHCRHLLAAYKVPAAIEVRESLPRGSTGKLLRRALRTEFEQGRRASR